MTDMFSDSAIDCDLSGWDVSNVRWHADMFTRCPLEHRPDKQPRFKVNEDFLDKHDVQLDSVSVLADACEDIQRWIEEDKPLLFDPQLLPDGCFHVSGRGGRKVLGIIVDKTIRDFGNECNLNWLDVSDVEMMNWLFSWKDFNGDISRWDTSSVTDMQAMFYNSTFNGNISQWDVSKVDNMYGIFCKSPFCQDLSMWNCASMRPDDLERAFASSSLPEEFKPKAGSSSLKEFK